ncbi:MAG: type II toxin-antitoxin system Phd/YefM family antitoxin [Geminicoccaceae bacterium]|nr:MAG: type II toxin-antitoxin system Phd/YefM family antitoxin [Geminicoccaceae bacterium]
MGLGTQIRSISTVKATAAEIVRELAEGGEPVIITVNGEAKAVIQSMTDYERDQETLALLKLLAMSEADSKAGRVVDAEQAFDDVLRDLEHHSDR